MNIATLDELKAYYPERLIIQFRGKTRWTKLMQAIVQEAWLDGIVQTEAACFDLETAVGAQLDILGRIVGVNRNVYGLDLTHTFFECRDYSGGTSGVSMQAYADTTPGPEIMLTYRSDAIYTMSEFEMRMLIKLKIIYNTAARTTKALTDALFSVFGSGVAFVDNKNLSVTFNVGAAYHTVFVIANYLNIIPKPMGISVTLNYV